MAELNTTFRQKANSLFNRRSDSSPIIPRMKKEASEIHEQMHRLYQAARQLRKTHVKAEIARLLGVSDQVVNNWEARGISDAGLLEAQAKIGCDAIWLRDGTGDMVHGQPLMPDLSDLAELVLLYGRMDKDDRVAVLRYARSQAPPAAVGRISANDKL